MPGPSLIDYLAALEDPRQLGTVLFPLPEVLVPCGTVAGAEDFVEIRRWGQRPQDVLRRRRPFKAGVPSHDTLNDVVNATDGAPFAPCFTAGVETPRDPAAGIHGRFATTDGDHGHVERRRSPGIEVRRHRVSHDVGWLTTARRLPGEPRLAGLRHRRRRSRGRAQRPHQPGTALLLVLPFHGDLSRLRSGAGPQNTATVRHVAMTLLRGPKKHSLKARRTSAAWNVDHLEALLRQSA